MNKHNYQKLLVYIHVILLILLVVDIFLIVRFDMSYCTYWLDRVIAFGWLMSGLLIFASYRRKGKVWSKLYYGTFLFYPITCALAFFIDRVFFAIIASPLITILLIPDVYYSDSKYEIRENSGIMTSKQLILIEKRTLVEKLIGTESLTETPAKYSNLKIIRETTDKIESLVSDGKTQSVIMFQK
ncbi:hypothetical protein [Xanthocytophaga agilis]|uniref:Uncharacterized protein n=1 Tax=Xanthocytophaga agilis TaxID=3048010 RepID=A0AAE3QZZ3_9BACT|nr:hypothetical protein [Xanthocytophaga agilis]MDJ1500600.1 hypothetical protein [Xanthocytophaga agilis]